jgi:hypothetical protein
MHCPGDAGSALPGRCRQCIGWPRASTRQVRGLLSGPMGTLVRPDSMPPPHRACSTDPRHRGAGRTDPRGSPGPDRGPARAGSPGPPDQGPGPETRPSRAPAPRPARAGPRPRDPPAPDRRARPSQGPGPVRTDPRARRCRRCIGSSVTSTARRTGRLLSGWGRAPLAIRCSRRIGLAPHRARAASAPRASWYVGDERPMIRGRAPAGT